MATVDPNVCSQVSGSSVFDSLNPFHMPCLSDQSVAVLHEIFGNAVTYFVDPAFNSNLGTLGQSGNNDFLIPLVLQHFNTLFCAAIILIYSFIVVIGTINTAHEGQFLGKQWSSFWTVARTIGGSMALIPSKLYGLCAAQFVVLYFLLLGVNAATAVWARSVNDIKVGVAPTTPTAMYGMITDAVGHSFVSTAVNEILNGGATTTSSATPLATQTVTLNQIGDQNLYNDIKQGMQNLCKATFLVVPANIPGQAGILPPPYSGESLSPDPNYISNQGNSSWEQNSPNKYGAGVFLTNAAALPADEYKALNNCLMNVQALFSNAGLPGQQVSSNGNSTAYYNETTSYVRYNGNNYPSQWFAWIGGTAPGSIAQETDANALLAYTDPNVPASDSFKQTQISWPSGTGGSNESTYQYTDGRALYNGFFVPTIASGVYFDGSADGRTVTGAPALVGGSPWTSCPAGHVCNDILVALLGQIDSGVGQVVSASGPPGSNLLGYRFKPAQQSANGEVLVSGSATYNPGAAPIDPSTQQPDQTAQTLINDLNDYAAIVNSGPNGSASTALLTYQIPGTGSSGPTTISVTPADCTQYIGIPAAQLPPSASSCNFTVLAQALTQQVMASQTGATCSIANNAAINPEGNNSSVTTTTASGSNNLPACPSEDSVATTPAEPYDVDLQMNSSWFYAGEVYLELDQMLAQNMSNLYAQFQNLSNSSIIPNYSAMLFATVGLQIAHYSGGLGNLVPGYSGLQSEYSRETGVLTYNNTSGLAYSIAPPDQNLEDHLGSWNATFFDSTGQALPNYITNTVLPLFKKGGALDQSYPGDAGHIAQIDQLLGEVPASMQLPFDVLFESSLFQGIQNGTSLTDESSAQTFFSQLDQLLAIMSINGLIKSPAQVATQVPTQQAVSDIFTGLLGPGGGMETQQGLNGILQEIYNIGEAPAGSNLVGQNLSVVANAQRVGIDVILTVITSITNVYHDFQKQIQRQITDSEALQGTALATSTALELGSTGLGILGMSDPMVAGSGLNPDGWADALGAGSQLMVQIAQMGETEMMITANWQLSQQLMYLPLFTAVMIMMFVIGVTFALMIPLTPFILFFGGFIAWILGTIEAIVAAPLLVLAIAHPGGHEVWGYSTPGFRMLLGVVLRPVLMVVGVLVAMALTYILISLSASAFHVAAAALIGGTALDGVTQLPGMIPAGIDPNGYARGTVALLMIFVYAQFMIKAFNKCFSAIYIIPERVITWIGGQTDQVGAQDLQELSGSLTSSAQQIGQAGGQGLQSGVGGGQQKMGATGSSHMEGTAQGSSRIGRSQFTNKQKQNKMAQEEQHRQSAANLGATKTHEKDAGL